MNLRTSVLIMAATLLLTACVTPADPPNGSDAGVLAFSGTVQGIDNGCFADGVCSVEVDGRTVVTLRGWSRSTWGHRDPGIEVGDAVDVRCLVEGTGCTLEGDAGYYLRKR